MCHLKGNYMKKRILFVCIHNSARSQMAEAFIEEFAGDRFVAESAGLEQGSLNPVVVAAMEEIGIDISHKESNTVEQFLAETRLYDYVVTVCDEGNAAGCPVFPGGGIKLHWGFDDPSGLAGSYEEKLASTRVIRDQIKEKIQNWLSSI